jgi:hypothetical protein
MVAILNGSIFLPTTTTTVHAFGPTLVTHSSSSPPRGAVMSRLFSVASPPMGIREPYTRRSTSSSSASTHSHTVTVDPETHSRQHDHSYYEQAHSRDDTWDPNPSTRTTTTTPHQSSSSSARTGTSSTTTTDVPPPQFNEWQQSVLRAELDLHHALLSGDLYTLEALWEEGCLMVDPYDRHMDKQDALEAHYHGLLPVDHYHVLPHNSHSDSIQIMAVPGRPDVALVIANVHFVGDMFPGHFVNEYVQYRRVWRRQPVPPQESSPSSTFSSSSSPPSPPHTNEPFPPTAPWWQVMREEASLMVPEDVVEGHDAQPPPPSILY